MVKDYPFEEIQLAENIVERTFSEDLSADELLWHWDDEDREVQVLHDTDWLFQFDNEYPIGISKSHSIFIPAGTWHRLIKGSGSLTILIKKYAVSN